MNDFFHRLNSNRHFRYGVPFLLFVIGGQYALSNFRSVRYDPDLNPKVGKFMSVKEYYAEERVLSGKKPQTVEEKPEKSLEQHLEELEKSNHWGDWENKRIPRPWEGAKIN